MDARTCAPRIVKIAFLNPTGALGGGERSLLDLIASLRAHDRSLQMHLIACDRGPLIELAQEAGAAVQVVAMPEPLARAGDSGLRERGWLKGTADLLRAGWSARSFVHQLDDAIAATGAELVHSNGIKTHLLMSQSRLELPQVWHIRDFISNRPIVHRLLSRGARRGVGIIAVSSAVADDARSWLGRGAEPVHVDVIHNAIDTEHFSPGEADAIWLDRLAGMPAAPPEVVRVGLIATYARWKGHDVLLRAAELLRDAAVRFYIAGGPIYRSRGSQFDRSELREMARHLGVEQHVGFVPFQLDPMPVYRALDIVVHASTRAEPFGRSIVEAMSCGRAVIATRAGGVTELVTDGHDALTVPPGDAPALAQAIARLAADAHLRQRIGSVARNTATQRFSRDRLGPQVMQIYRRLLEDRGGDTRVL